MRTIALAVIAVLVLGGAVPAPASSDDHANALAALADERAAVAEIVRIEDGYAVGHGAYLRAAHRALNALVGRRDDGYAARSAIPATVSERSVIWTACSTRPGRRCGRRRCKAPKPTCSPPRRTSTAPSPRSRWKTIKPIDARAGEPRAVVGRRPTRRVRWLERRPPTRASAYRAARSPHPAARRRCERPRTASSRGGWSTSRRRAAQRRRRSRTG